MFKTYGGSLIAGKVGYVVSCLLAAVVLVSSGFAHRFVSLANAFGSGITLDKGPDVGAMNILVMGLESRTDYEGNVLSSQLLTAMHAGSVYGVTHLGVGGQATNTLILIHIFAGGQKAIGYSIARDDLVTFPHPYSGLSQGKIDQAYGFAWSESLSKTVNSGMSNNQRYLLANQAGQQATVDTVQAVTGQHIDHFAEVNLAGFFYLAQAFHGIMVCVKPTHGFANLHDANSGFNGNVDGYNYKKGGPQYLHLYAPQALAFVRERDSLPNGDIDRTHRQQAVLDYVIWKLKNDGVLNDIGTLTALLSTAQKYIITDSNWNLLDFATNMRALTGRNMTFHTLPIASTQNGYPLNGAAQDVNIINVPYVQQVVKNAFAAPPSAKKSTTAKSTDKKKAAPIPPASTVTVDVYNGGSTSLLALHVQQALVSLGYKTGSTGNGSAQSQTVQSATRVFYGAGATANAAKIAHYFGATAESVPTLPAGHVEVLLGTASTDVPAALSAASGAAGGSTPSSGTTPSATVTPTNADNGQAGSAVTVGANAKYGIPCVY
jgi:LCP family protein required for cell wall assembly